MPIYINKNNQQSGPYEDHIVLEQLRTGTLSPDDLGIRHGGKAWQRLGEMFPDAVPSRTAVPPVGASVAAGTEPARLVEKQAAGSGGCRRMFGITLLIFGILIFLGGVVVAIATPYGYSTMTCDMADEDKKRVDELMKKYEAAKGTDKELSIKVELESEMQSFKYSNEACAGQLSTKRMFQVGSIVVAVIGFFIAVIGFFVRRV